MADTENTTGAQAGEGGGVDYAAKMAAMAKEMDALKAERDTHATRAQTLAERRKADQLAAHLADLADPEYSNLPSIQGAIEWDDDGGLTTKAVDALKALRQSKPALFAQAKVAQAEPAKPAAQVQADPIMPASRSTGKMTKADWNKLYRSDPIKAMTVLNNNDVEV